MIFFSYVFEIWKIAPTEIVVNIAGKDDKYEQQKYIYMKCKINCKRFTSVDLFIGFLIQGFNSVT